MTTEQSQTKAHGYTYRAILAASERINWRVEDIIGGDKRLDFTRPFMPESLARVEPLGFLSPYERLRLNQIRGHGYLCLFGVFEEFILPYVLDHARARLDGDDYRVRALLRFAGEEAKHMHLFRRFREEFAHGFGHECAVIGPAADIARKILSHDPLAVALVILQGEWMTQRHYLEGIRDDRGLDPQFASLLRHHWMEEAQHARLDTLMIEALAERYTRCTLSAAVEEYVVITAFLDGGLTKQVELDLEALTRATGRELVGPEREAFLAVQRQAMRWTFVGSGMTHESFLGTLGGLSASARARVEKLAPSFC
jgi:hypothetical protein